jgi:lactosylceramide 4-alpha-galactosyltransferase
MNYVGLESADTVASCVLSFDFVDIGHAVADRCLDQIRTNFRGNIWAYNGPELITRVLLRMCHTLHVSPVSSETFVTIYHIMQYHSSKNGKFAVDLPVT